MSMHEDIAAAIQAEIDGLGCAIALSPASVAIAVQRRFSASPIEPHLQYSSLEHLKQMARRALAGRYEADGEESVAYQGDLFSGHLQERYPVPRQRGQEPTYKLRTALSLDEAAWNVEQLRKAATARMRHADALQAWNEGRAPGMVNDL